MKFVHMLLRIQFFLMSLCCAAWGPDTRILTPQGFRQIRNLKSGDKVISIDASMTIFTQAKVLAVKQQKFSGCYQFTLGEHGVFVTPDQLVYDPDMKKFVHTSELVTDTCRAVNLSEEYKYRYSDQHDQLITLYEISVEQSCTYFVSEAFLLGHVA